MSAENAPKTITVMIVDDEAFFRKLLHDILTEGGMSVVAEAGDGREAVEQFRHHRPDVILMDIYMAEMSGIDATREIISVDSNAHIFICSGVGFDQDLDAALQAGAQGVIYKPFYAEEVLDTIRRAVSI